MNDEVSFEGITELAGGVSGLAPESTLIQLIGEGFKIVRA